MKRRQFFQQTSHLLAVMAASWLGVGKSGLANPLFVQYQSQIPASNGRKLALLVGIDRYASPLAGCVTDVELQKELLIYRFGFQPADIVVLTDRQASRENIQIAFLEHLTKQAKAGDLVVFHFSGYGTQIPVGSFGRSQNALVTLEKRTGDFLGWDDLQELMRSLATQRVITILDTSFSESQTQLPANWRWRSYPQTDPDNIADNWRSLGLGLAQAPPIAKLPGFTLKAAANDLFAGERNWGGFTAGIFTYSLTRELWAATDATAIAVNFQQTETQIAETIGKWQQPILERDNNRFNDNLDFKSFSHPSLGTEGAIISLEERPKHIKVWLGGWSTHLQGDRGLNSLFTAIVEPPLAPIIVQVRHRQGLLAQAKVISNPDPDLTLVGRSLQELVRVLPRQIGLIVGLNPELERIERVDATSTLANVPGVSVVTNPGESADYWLGKQPQNLKSEQSAPIYGLYALNGDPIPETMGGENEAIKLAVNRLRQPLQHLLAAKIWQLTENQTTSHLGLKATLETREPNAKVMAELQTQRSPKLLSNPPKSSGIVNLPPQASIQYRLANWSDRQIYFLIVGVDGNGHPVVWEPLTASIAPGATQIVPEPTASDRWIVGAAPGLAEIYLICTTAPFDKAIATIQAQVKGKGLLALSQPLEVTQAILEDIHQASAKEVEAIAPDPVTLPDPYALDVSSWATLRFAYKCF
jgi:hypothetical protein